MIDYNLVPHPDGGMIKEPPLFFEESGRQYKLFLRKENAYMYKVNNEYYEVFRRLVEGKHPKDKDPSYQYVVPYPNDESFGDWAKIVYDLDRAKAHMYIINEGSIAADLTKEQIKTLKEKKYI